MIGFFNRIVNSEIMMKIRNAINSFIDSFSLAGVKQRVDTFVDESQKSEETTSAFNGLNKKVDKFINRKLGGKIKSTKALSVITKIISVLLSLGFAGLVIYMMIKLLPKIIMMVAMIFAVWISIELILCILNRAVTRNKIVVAQ